MSLVDYILEKDSRFQKIVTQSLSLPDIREGSEGLVDVVKYITRYKLEDIEELCRSYGITSTAWEYMWEAINRSIQTVDVVSWGRRLAYPMALDSHWRVTNSGFTHIGFSSRLWTFDSPWTVSVIMLSFQLDPVKVYRFCKACSILAEYLIFGGQRPDMKFPYQRDPQEAYHLLSATEVMRRLAE